MKEYSLFIVDDHKIVRDGLKAMLLARPNIKVIAEAASIQEALTTITTIKPDLIFVDLKLPDGNGSELLAKLIEIRPTSKCALLTADPNLTDLKRAQQAGALAFLTKDMDAQEYLLAIDKMLVGKTHISNQFSDLLLDQSANYTPRELEVLQGFSDGLSYKEIGGRLDISPRTVETHKNHLLEKMQVKSIVEMVRKAIREGLIKA